MIIDILIKFIRNIVKTLYNLHLILKLDTIIEPSENQKYFHHVILNECTREIETNYFSNHSQIPGGFCYKSQNPEQNRWGDVDGLYCTRMSLLWQVGGDTVN